MFFRNIIILVFSVILLWDLVTAGPSKSTLMRAGKEFIGLVQEGVEWSQNKVDEIQINNKLRKTKAAHNAAMQEIFAMEEDQTGSSLSPDETFIIPAPHTSTTNDFGDSVFSRKAIKAFIDEASALTDISDHYLSHLAERESAFDPVAAAGTSSATGLYQFTESTWLDVFARYGKLHGQDELVRHIMISANGRPSVESKRIKRHILNLRLDPKLSTFMAAHYAHEQRKYLRRKLEREPNYAELYIAHFLGSAGAAKLFIAYERTPRASAVELFPAAANANKRFFYNRKGKSVDIATLHKNLITLCADLLPQV